MSNITRTIARDMPNGDYIEVAAEERDGTDGLSAGFAITADVWEKRGTVSGRARKRLGREQDAGGCMHEEILRAFPNLAPMVHVHLSSPDGLPMHAKANGWYFYSGDASAYERKQVAAGKDYGYSRNLLMSDHDRAARALHIAPADLPAGLTETEFGSFVDGLAERYAEDVADARRVLSAMVDGAGVESVA